MAAPSVKPITANARLGFLSLPCEIRTRIYSILLSHLKPLDQVYHPEPLPTKNLATGLLGANKTVRQEAMELFFSQNKYHIVRSPARVESFLEGLGDAASLIQHVVIPFPQHRQPSPGKYILNEDDAQTLALIQSKCTNLVKLTASLHTVLPPRAWTPRGLKPILELENWPELLNMFAGHFKKGFPLLKEVEIDIDEDTEWLTLSSIMHHLGWTINVVPKGEDQEWTYDPELANAWRTRDPNDYSDMSEPEEDDVDYDDLFDF